MTFVIVHNGLPRSNGHGRRRRLTNRQAFSLGVIDLSSVCVEEHLTDCGVVVIHLFGEPLLGHGLLIELDVSLCEEEVLGLITCEGKDLSLDPISLAKKHKGFTTKPRWSWRVAGTAGGWWGMREGRWRWWRDHGSQRKRSLQARMRWDKHSDILSHAMCARNECDNARLRRLTTTITFTCSPSVSRHCRVSCALCWSWFSRCHWCRTSHRSTGRFLYVNFNTLNSCMMTLGWNETQKQTSWADVRCARDECDNSKTETDYEDCKTTRTLTCSCCASCWFLRILVFTLSLVWFYSSTAFHHANATPNAKFFPSGCCSPTVSCHRQLNLNPKFLLISYRENGSVSVFKNFRPQDFLWILAATPGCRHTTALDLSRQTTGLHVLSWFPLYLFLDLGWRGSYADEVHLGKSFRAKDFGLECLRDVQRLSWILHIGSVSVCLSSSEDRLRRFISWNTQPNCRDL